MAYEPIDWKALKDLSKRGHVIGCHSMSHARLSTLTNDADFKREIVDAGKKISDRLECEVSWFAYPFGDIKSINRKAINIIGENYRYCCSGLRGINTQSTNSLCISRQSQQLNQPLNFSANVALGAFDFVYMFKYFKLNRMVQ